MFNKNLVVISSAVVVSGAVGFCASKAAKKFMEINEQKKKEKTFFDILRECIEEEADYCISIGILDKSMRDKVINQVFKDTKEFVKNSGNLNSVFELSSEDQKTQLKSSISNSHFIHGWV